MSLSPEATLGRNVTLGEYVVIEEDVQIGDDVEIGHHVIIRKGVRIGRGCKILDGALLGKRPAKATLSAMTQDNVDLPLLVLGAFVTVGASATLYRGSSLADGVFLGDLATIREKVTIGKESIIGCDVTVENNVIIGKRCKIESKAYITGLSLIEDYCFIAPCVAFSNDNYLGRTEERKMNYCGPILRKGARVGIHATILPGVEIGEDAVVGAGSVVTKNVPTRQIVIGCPASFFREVPKNQLITNQTFYEEVL